MRNALRFFRYGVLDDVGRGVVPSASAATSTFVCEPVMQYLLAMVRIVKAAPRDRRRAQKRFRQKQAQKRS
jgi:hypothetical protein